MDAKKEFLVEEFLTLTIIGSLTRGVPVYNENVTEKQKDEFRKFLRVLLKEYSKQYFCPVCDSEHISNLLKFQSETEKFAGILSFGKLKIGRVQKLLNLYLKYLWVWGEMPKPPHCPFDSIIINGLGLNISWTDLDDVNDYKLIVEKAKIVSGEADLADWELNFWNKNK